MKRKDLILKVLMVLMIIMILGGCIYLFSQRNNLEQIDYPTIDEESDYGNSLINQDKQPEPDVNVSDDTKLPSLTDTLTNINYNDFKKLFESTKKSMVVVVKDGCSFCKAFLPTLEDALNSLVQKIYVLNTSNLSIDEKKDLGNYIYIEGTPTTYVIKNGSVTGAIEGNKSEEIIKSWIELFYVRNNTSDNTSSN